MRNVTENQVFLNVDKILKVNLESTKRQPQKWKFQKFNYLKYKHEPIEDQTPATTHANAFEENNTFNDPKTNVLRKPSKTNIQEETLIFLKKLELLHPAHTLYRRKKSPTKVPSNTIPTSTSRDK